MEDMYRKLFDGLPCYVTAQDRTFLVVASHRRFRRDFGGGEGRYCFELYKGRTEKCPVCVVEQTFEDGKHHRSEELVRGKDGRDRYVIVYTAPILDDEGRVTNVVEMSADITEVKQLQQTYRALFDVVPCYISVQNRDLTIRDANRRFHAHFGDGIGDPCYEIYKHRTEPCLDCPVARTFQDGDNHQSEEVITCKDGERKNVLCHTAPIFEPTGEILAVMEMSTDITELRQLQSRLTSLGMLVGSVSHGIKGLLSGLDGGIYLMETGLSKGKEERIQQGWDMVKRNVERIRSMVMNVLYYGKDREVYWQDIDVEDMATSVVEVLESRAGQLGVELEVNAAEGTFEGDQSAVHSLLVNLLENALDACRIDKRQIPHRVSLTAGLQKGHVVFEVADNGIGMDQETKEKAFSLFFSSKGAEGTGLGLFIANKIVRAHLGSIRIESALNLGTTFLVKLPIQRPPQTDSP